MVDQRKKMLELLKSYDVVAVVDDEPKSVETSSIKDLAAWQPSGDPAAPGWYEITSVTNTTNVNQTAIMRAAEIAKDITAQEPEIETARAILAMQTAGIGLSKIPDWLKYSLLSAVDGSEKP